MLSTTTPDNWKKTLYGDLPSLLSSTCVIRVVLSVSLLVSYFVINFIIVDGFPLDKNWDESQL